MVRELLDSDERIFEYVREHLSSGKTALGKLIRAAGALYALQTSIPVAQQVPRSSLVVDALSGQLRQSAWERSLLLRLRKCNSEALRNVLLRLQKVSSDDLGVLCTTILHELDQLLQGQAESGGPLRSEEDIQNSTLRTTVIAKKVELSKQKSTMTKGDAAYSNLLRVFTVSFERYLAEALIDPRALVFNEIFMYDQKSPHRDVFTPKPRFAVERALAAPHDYLDCACCAADSSSNEENTLSSTQPATAILYQLYLESGAMINASDLRTAFFTIKNVNDEDELQQS